MKKKIRWKPSPRKTGVRFLERDLWRRELSWRRRVLDTSIEGDLGGLSQDERQASNWRIIQKLNEQNQKLENRGPDFVTNFWMKQLTSLLLLYLSAINRILSGEANAPLWLTQGTRRLIPKTAQTQLLNKYRPICCLPATYKLLTAIISEVSVESTLTSTLKTYSQNSKKTVSRVP